MWCWLQPSFDIACVYSPAGLSNSHQQHATQDSPPAVMPVSAAPAPLLCVLLLLSVSVALQRSDTRLIYVTHGGFSYYSCSQDPQPCSVSSLAECRCKEIQLSLPHRAQSHSLPVLRARRLTVWFTSPSYTARLLNNSEVRHLTLVHCGLGEPKGRPSPSFLRGHFAVQHLEKLTVVSLPRRQVVHSLDANRAKSSDSQYSDTDGDSAVHIGTNRYNKAKHINLDFFTGMKKDSLALSSAQIQDILLDRELGAAYHEQARLGIIHGSVLELGAVVKAYTVQTHIDNQGMLPFPELHLPKLPETSVIYVSFVY